MVQLQVPDLMIAVGELSGGSLALFAAVAVRRLEHGASHDVLCVTEELNQK